MEASPHPWPTLGVLLLRDGLVTKDTLVEILDEQRDARRQRITGRRLGEIVVERGLVTSDQVARLVAEQYELPYLELELDDIDVKVAGLLDEDQMARYSAVPISRRADGSYLLAVADPSTVVFSDEIREILGAVPHFAVVGPEALADALAYVRSRRVVGLLTADNGIAAAEPEPDHFVLSTVPDAAPAPAFETGRAAAHLWPPLGALLVREGLLNDEELETALAQQRLSTSRRLGEILVERGTVTPADVARLVAKQYELDYIELDERGVDASTARLLPETVARTYRAVPIALRENGELDVAIADPTLVLSSDTLHAELGAPVRFLVASPDVIDRLIAAVHETADEPGLDEEPAEAYVDVAFSPEEGRDELPATEEIHTIPFGLVELQSVPEPTDALEDTPDVAVHEAGDESPLEEEPAEPYADAVAALEAVHEELPATEEIQTVPPLGVVELQPVSDPTDVVEDAPDVAVRAALEAGADAVHVWHQSGELRVRARVDGSLGAVATFELEDLAALVGELAADPAIELHVVPTHTGSKLTLRRVHADAPRTLADLGVSREAEDAVRAGLADPGVVVVTGVPGSGVTSTLHALLAELSGDDRVVATIESRVSAIVEGVDQIEVGEEAAFTVASALQALAAADTDVVMIDAPLDQEAAELAARVALGGCRVLVGQHQPDASAAITSLTGLAADTRPIASALTCVVGQHLVRTVCADCRETYYATPSEVVTLERPTEDMQRLLVRGRGCASCNGTGLRGVQAIFETVTVTEALRQLVQDGAPDSALRASAAADGTTLLRQQAILLCLEGMTTSAEVERAPATAP